MQIAVFGGSFSPIHIGHIALVKEVLKQGLAQEVWLIVSPQNPLKKSDKLWNDELRLKLAELAIEDIPGVRVCDIEFRLPRPSYMAVTLERLCQENPNDDFTLLIGEDNLEIFDQWYHYEEILQRHKLIVYPRAGGNGIRSNLPNAQIQILNADLHNISSTEIREQIKKGDYNGEGLPTAVWNYIKMHVL